ncbi:MAG: hypothetical protein VCB24_00590 [Pseudomonas sp.]|uniref:hypothetical protein n=1 Tax=Pseudomonas sp. TaxID=306 RepID=UPI003982BA8A
MSENLLVIDKDLEKLSSRLNVIKESINKAENNIIDFEDIYDDAKALAKDLEILMIFGRDESSKDYDLKLFGLYNDFWKSILKTDDDVLTFIFDEVNKGGHTIIIQAYLRSELELTESQRSEIFLHENREVHLFKLDEIANINQVIQQYLYMYLITGDNIHVENVKSISDEISHLIKTDELTVDEYLARYSNN